MGAAIHCTYSPFYLGVTREGGGEKGEDRGGEQTPQVRKQQG